MSQLQALVYGRTKPEQQVTNITVCGIDFTPSWQPIHNVDAATVARLAADVDIEISLQYPGGLPFVLDKLAEADAIFAQMQALRGEQGETLAALATSVIDTQRRQIAALTV